MSREDPQMKIRITDDLRERLRMSASRNGRSLNSEIVLRLEQTYDREAEQRVSDDYVAWLESGCKGEEPEMPDALRQQNFRVNEGIDAEIDAKQNANEILNIKIQQVYSKIEEQDVSILRILDMLEVISNDALK
ncbi:Arc family DNA-binding protein [uncultured Devosia sp.]|uniref:Arc family DNA-binding protein n=1 Tax=uncultured Devosia sp. TaxID=211434 RepID=UPI0030EE96E1|tara:strand:+ start:284 stop:685 length:402 start_codon:yes stop_codon:yes gene_type:complete